ncbi:eCIS core domain-containing protein [Streptomyces sp. NPDC002990]
MQAHENAQDPAKQAAKHPATENGRAPARTTAARTTAAEADMRRQGLLALQRTAGNAAVVQLLREAGHPWAQEEHRHGPGCGHRAAAAPAPEAPVQRSTVHDVLAAPGKPLDVPLREEMERRLGADFSDVRVHDDSAARASAAEVGARAYTSGSHVVIGEGGGDKHTLAHELTHVIQQRQGPVSGTDNGAGLKVSDPSDRFEREAEANATRVMSGAVPGPSPAQAPREARTAQAAPAAGASSAVQRVMDPATFKQETAVPFKNRGSSSIAGVDAQLEKYGEIGRGKRDERIAALADIVARCKAYLEGGHSKGRTAGVTKLRDQAAAEQSLLESVPSVPAADLEPTVRFHELLSAMDKAMREEGKNEEYDYQTGLLNLPDVAFQTAKDITDAQFSTLMQGYVGALERMAAEADVPAETAEMLREVIAVADKVDFVKATTSRPGMSAQAPYQSGATDDRRYTFNVDTQPRGGTPFLLGHVAHELTHVAAHQAYDATDTMLLVPYGSTPAQVGEMARTRQRTLSGLHSALEGERELFTGTQYRLLEEKVLYGSSRNKVLQYADAYRKAGKLSDEDHARLKAWDEAAGDASGTLVEYDTVLNQMLVYLHMWQTPTDSAFYTELRAAAATATADRRTARESRPGA